MIKVELNPGICGFKTEIKVTLQEDFKVKVVLDSKCPHLKKVDLENKEIDVKKELSKKLHNTLIYDKLSRHIPHLSCPIYPAVFKGIEVETGLALPGEVNIKFN